MYFSYPESGREITNVIKLTCMGLVTGVVAPFIMAGVISFINPGYINTLFTDPRGWVMIGMGLTSLLVGLGVMSKMIKFEI